VIELEPSCSPVSSSRMCRRHDARTWGPAISFPRDDGLRVGGNRSLQVR
jgi:hypothetical protein